MILKKADLTKRLNKDSVLEKIRSDKKNIHLLLEWSQLTEHPIGWRSSWLLRQSVQKNDSTLKPYIGAVLKKFTSFNESQKREWLKLLSNQTMSENEEGILFDISVSEWKKVNNHPALRSSAFNIMFRILQTYPELRVELSHLMTSDYVDSLSPGIKRIILKSWKAVEKS